MAELETLKEDLIESDDHFRQLHLDHQDCEKKLEGIVQKDLLTQEDEIEEKRLKRRKLLLKDKMHLRMRKLTRATA